MGEQFKGKPLVIGFGHEAQQGKDTVVNHLVKTFGPRPEGEWGKYFPLDVRRYAFADPLKIEVFDYLQARTFFVANANFELPQGLPEPARLYSYQEKLDFINANKKEHRGVLQLWGTEYRRAQHPQYWVNQTDERIHTEKPQVALITDMRFVNETRICDYTVRVVREGFQIAQSSHASEQELANHPYHYVLSSPEGDVEGLKKNGEVIFEHILKLAGLLPR